MKWYMIVAGMLFTVSFSIPIVAESVAKKVMVIGGITTIGRELAKQYIQKGCKVGFMDDNKVQLEAFQVLENGALAIQQVDFSDVELSRTKFLQLIEELGGMDMCIVALSIAPEISEYGLLKDGDIPWPLERQTIAVNVSSTAALMNLALNYFIDQGMGHLVGVSSLDALHGHPGCPVYTASKAFMANYLSGMRTKMDLLTYSDIYITDLRWSFIQDIKQSIAIGWVETPQEAALHMIEAINQKKRVAYIMSRWSFILWGLLAMPSMVKDMLSGVSMLKTSS